MMNPRSIVVQQPTPYAAQLILMFHGYGASAEDLLPLAQQLALAFPAAAVVSVSALEATGYPGGYQWFDLEGITDELRVERLAAALPAFLDEIHGWQDRVGVTPAATALVGFSQGAMMALEAGLSGSPPAGRVVGISGRFSRLPDTVPAQVTFHLLHGQDDPVVSCDHTVAAAQRLRELSADVTADVFPFVGHTIDEDMASLVVQRLKSYVPRRLWDEAMQSS
jgi:phospholipase/carboxylesterase